MPKNNAITVENAEAISAALKAMSRRAETEVDKALLKSAQIIEANAKRNAPVDTGTLRASIHSKLSDDKNGESQVIAAANYARFVEYGTRKMAAQPYMRPAVEANRERVAELIKEALNRAKP